MTYVFHRNEADVVRNIENLRSFEHGGIAGRRGGTTRLERLPRQYRQGLAEAYYVVLCYGTPIAWVTYADPEDDESARCNYMPDWQYSATTTYYQKLVWKAWGDKVQDPNPAYSRDENRGTDRGRSSDVRYGRAPAPEPRRRPRATAADPLVPGLVTNHRGVQYDPQVERDTSYERDMVEARSRGSVAAHPQATEERYQTGNHRRFARGGEEQRAQDSIAVLLDPRYRNPDWTPERLPEGAEDRDLQRVRLDLAERRNPAHP
jgi:hypothetical protein